MNALIRTQTIDFSSVSLPPNGEYLLGVDYTDGKYKKLNPDGTLVNLEDAGGGLASILQNGNTFAADIKIGSNDNFSLLYKTNSVIRGGFYSNEGFF